MPIIGEYLQTASSLGYNHGTGAPDKYWYEVSSPQAIVHLACREALCCLCLSATGFS